MRLTRPLLVIAAVIVMLAAAALMMTGPAISVFEGEINL